MELDWTTFVLEIINFLILVWLLKRFLYRPVLDFVARRRAETEEAMASARHEQQEAETLRQQYERRLDEWAQEREAARAKLHHELEQERSKRLADIKRTLAEERERASVAEERRQREFRENAEQTALALGARFAARVLTRTSGPESTAALAALVTDEITALPSAQRTTLRQAGSGQDTRGSIETAHALDAKQQQALEAALTELFGKQTEWHWQVVPDLVAGVRIAVGAWVLAANVRDELQDFTLLSRG